MQSLGFENYTEALKIYLGKYREVSFFLVEKFEEKQVINLYIDYKD